MVFETEFQDSYFKIFRLLSQLLFEVEQWFLYNVAAFSKYYHHLQSHRHCFRNNDALDSRKWGSRVAFDR